MKFDLDKIDEYLEKKDEKRLLSLAYTYKSNVTYVRETEYTELINLINCIINKIYYIDSREVKEAFFDVLIYAIEINYSKIKELEECINTIAEIINENKIESWDLAESLLIISSTCDKKYFELMKGFKNSPDSYVREIVNEYFQDIFEKN